MLTLSDTLYCCKSFLYQSLSLSDCTISVNQGNKVSPVSEIENTHAGIQWRFGELLNFFSESHSIIITEVFLFFKTIPMRPAFRYGIYIYIYIYIYINVCVCVCACARVCMYVCIYILIYLQDKNSFFIFAIGYVTQILLYTSFNRNVCLLKKTWGRPYPSRMPHNWTQLLHNQ